MPSFDSPIVNTNRFPGVVGRDDPMVKLCRGSADKGSMVPVHDQPCPEPVPSCGRRRAGGFESGFTIIELLVVLIIVAVLMVLLAPNALNQHRSSANPALNASAGAIWRGVQRYRMDNRGTFPNASMVKPTTPSTFVDAANEPYIRRWPAGPDGLAQQVTTASSATIPVSVAATPNGQVLYYGAGNVGWVAAYSPHGNLVLRRGATATANPPRPAG